MEGGGGEDGGGVEVVGGFVVDETAGEEEGEEGAGCEVVPGFEVGVLWLILELANPKLGKR